MTFSSSRAAGAIALAVGAAIALAGCSGGGSPATTPDPGATDFSGKTLTVWFPGNDPAEEKQVEDTIVPAFEKETGATVKVTYVDWGDLSTKLSAAFAAGNAPDVFGHGPAAVADFAVNQRLLPLDDYVKSLPEADQKDLAAALPGGQVDGVQYLIPLQMSGQLLAYDKDDFTKAGLDPDMTFTSWEDVRAAAEKLTKRDSSGKITRSGLLLPTDPVGRQQSFATLITAAGGKQLDDQGKVAFDSAEGQEALDFYTGLFSGSDAVATGIGVPYLSSPNEQQPLVTDSASITMLNGNAVAKLATAYPDMKLGIIPPLGLKDGDQPAAFGGAGNGLMINAATKNPNLAWKFIETMISPDVNIGYVKSFGGVPVRLSAVDSDYVKSSWVLEALVKASPTFVPNPNVPGWVQARDTMDQYLEKALNGKGSNQDILSQMATAVDDILQKSR